MTRIPLPASMLRAALVSAALAIPAHAQIPGFPTTPDCPPNSSCVPGTCGPGPGGATCGAVTATVNMPAYLEWLKNHGYNISLTGLETVPPQSSGAR